MHQRFGPGNGRELSDIMWTRALIGNARPEFTSLMSSMDWSGCVFDCGGPYTSPCVMRWATSSAIELNEGFAEGIKLMFIDVQHVILWYLKRSSGY